MIKWQAKKINSLILEHTDVLKRIKYLTENKRVFLI